jgi:VWFA-related protein
MRRLLALLFLTTPLLAQAPYVESVEVRITNIDVIVTDRAGKPVIGLGKDDFELHEDGKLQTITNLYEVRESAEETTAAPPSAPAAPAPPQEMRRRRFVFFIDNYSLGLQRQLVMTSLQKFLDTHMRPEDEALVVMWDRQLHIVLPFSSDRAAIDGALRTVMKRLPHGDLLESEKSRFVNEMIEMQSFHQRKSGRGTRTGVPTLDSIAVPQEIMSRVKVFSENMRADLRSLFDSVNVMLTSLGGVEGKKVMVFVGAYMPDRPGLEIYERLATLGMPIDVSRALAEIPSQSALISGIARHANAEGVTLYTIFAEDPQNRDDWTKFQEFTNSAQPLAMLADMTGGTMLSKTPNFDLLFETVAHDVSSYYSLGYRSTDNAAAQHSISVRTKNPQYRVRTRKTLVVKSTDEKVGDNVVANIVHPVPRGDFHLELRLGEIVKAGRGQFRVPVEVLVPGDAVTLLPAGTTAEGKELIAGGFTVYIAAGTKEGALSPVSKREQSIRVPAAIESTLRAKPLTFRAEVLLGKGESILSVAVVDQLSNVAGFARTTVVTR